MPRPELDDTGGREVVRRSPEGGGLRGMRFPLQRRIGYRNGMTKLAGSNAGFVPLDYGASCNAPGHLDQKMHRLFFGKRTRAALASHSQGLL